MSALTAMPVCGARLGRPWAESWSNVKCRIPLKSFTTAYLLVSRTDPIMQTQNEEKIFPTLLRDFTGSHPHPILQPSQNQGRMARKQSSLVKTQWSFISFIHPRSVLRCIIMFPDPQLIARPRNVSSCMVGAENIQTCEKHRTGRLISLWGWWER